MDIMGSDTDQRITDFLSAEDRDLVVSGLQALWRERVTAYNIACDVAARADLDAPLRSAFGVNEVEGMLRRWGAAPQKF